MESLKTKILNIDWQAITEALNDKGFAIVADLLSNEQSKELIDNYTNPNSYRKTVMMER